MKRLLANFLVWSMLLGVILRTSVAQNRAVTQETLIRNATVLTITHGTLANTDVQIRNGKIAAIGKNLKAAANARVIDATDKFVMPGIIDCHSHSMLDAINEGSLSVTSMVRTRDALNEESIHAAPDTEGKKIDIVQLSADVVEHVRFRLDVTVGHQDDAA